MDPVCPTPKPLCPGNGPGPGDPLSVTSGQRPRDPAPGFLAAVSKPQGRGSGLAGGSLLPLTPHVFPAVSGTRPAHVEGNLKMQVENYALSHTLQFIPVAATSPAWGHRPADSGLP